MAAQKADFEEGKRACLNNGDKNFCECERKNVRPFSADRAPDGYYHRVLFALIALFLVLGVTHTSFFGLFGG